MVLVKKKRQSGEEESKALNRVRILNVIMMFKTKRKKGQYKDKRANINMCYEFTKFYDHLENGTMVE